MKNRIITYILLLLVATGASAAVNIRGKVTDEKNEPMEFVTVRIAGTAIGGTTGLDGGFSLSAPEADTIRVIFTCIGYDDARRTLVKPKGEVSLTVKMTPKESSLQEVQVTDFVKQTSQMQTVNPGQVHASPDATGGSVESIIQTMAGVRSNNEMSAQYSVRGGTYDENSVYINGVEVYRPQLVTSGQQEGLSIINPDMVGAIGFSTGGYSAEYGDKMSSVLDITYRQPQSFEGSASLSLMGGSVAIGTSSRKFSMLHGLRYKSNASLLQSMDEKGDYDPRFFDYQTFMNYKLHPKWTASALGNISINNYRFIPHNRSTSFGTMADAKQFTVYFDGQEKDRFETFFGALSLQFMPSRKTNFTLLASGYLTNELVTYDISGEYWLDQAGTGGDQGIGGELGVGKYLEHARNRLKASVMSVGLRGNTGINYHNLSYGVTFNYERIHDRSREWELRDSAGYSLPSDGEHVRMIYNLDSRHDISTNRFSAFVQDAYRLSTAAGLLTVNGGLRLSYWDYNKEWLLSPRLSVGFVPEKNSRWTMRFSTGLYYQSPFYKEYRKAVQDADGNTVIQLNNNIKSQRSVHFIAGADYTFRAFGRPFKLSGEAYYKLLGNLIPYEIDNLKVTYAGENTSKGFAAGLDFKLFGQFVPGSDSWLSFSLMKTQENLNGVKVPRPTDQRYSVALFFTDYFPKLPRLKFSLRGIFSDGLPVTPPRGSRDRGYFRTPAYKRLDIGFAYALVSEPKEGQPRSGLGKVLKSAWLGLDVFNLFDISNVSGYYWVTDVNDIQYAVPNYLTRRQINVRLSVEF